MICIKSVCRFFGISWFSGSCIIPVHVYSRSDLYFKLLRHSCKLLYGLTGKVEKILRTSFIIYGVLRVNAYIAGHKRFFGHRKYFLKDV